MAFKPSEKRKTQEGTDELDLTPYMNFVMILIPVLMQATEYVKLAMLKIDLPPAKGGASGGQAETPPPPEEETLDLAVAVTKGGFTITSKTATMPIIPLKGDKYDYAELGKQLWQLKQQVTGRYPDDTKIIIAASLETRYEIIVKTMDASRVYVDKDGKQHLLFPDASLSPGIT